MEIKIGKLSLGYNKKAAVQTNTPVTLPSSTYIASGVPVWRNLSELSYLLKCYCENPIVQAVINIKADAMANMRFFVREYSTDEIFPLEKYDKDGGKLKKLLSRPNPLQSGFEWLKQFKVNYEVFGNGYAYASLPVGYENRFTYQDISVINNLPPYCITPILSGRWLDATRKDEIIKEYELRGLNGSLKYLNTNTVFHANNTNIRFDANFTQGTSELIALQAPITNIDYAYESRNVLIRKRGALGILTSEAQDGALGSVPLKDEEIKDVQERFKMYGLLDDQYQQIISPVPLKYQKMAMSVKELMLFEEIESDAIAIANSFGVPELLVKYYIKGGTFNNLDASEKRLYDSTIIPESYDFITNLNSFLGTESKGIELIGSFDHLNALQINKKEEAETDKINQETSLSAFMIGAITYDDYLTSIGMPNDDQIGGLRIWDLDERQLMAIGIAKNNGNGKGENK